jgi:hypothetical protein
MCEYVHMRVRLCELCYAIIACTLKDVTRLLQEGVTRVLQGCCKDVTRMLQGYQDTTWCLQGCYRNVPRLPQLLLERVIGQSARLFRHAFFLVLSLTKYSG